MRTSDIGSILNSFFENKSYRAILIDGKWGIGKTYQFKKFFDGLHRKERRKVFYFTVFGTETMNELNTRIYRKLHPFWSLIKVGYKTISQSVDAVSRGKKVHRGTICCRIKSFRGDQYARKAKTGLLSSQRIP